MCTLSPFNVARSISCKANAGHKHRLKDVEHFAANPIKARVQPRHNFSASKPFFKDQSTLKWNSPVVQISPSRLLNCLILLLWLRYSFLLVECSLHFRKPLVAKSARQIIVNEPFKYLVYIYARPALWSRDKCPGKKRKEERSFIYWMFDVISRDLDRKKPWKNIWDTNNQEISCLILGWNVKN